MPSATDSFTATMRGLGNPETFAGHRPAARPRVNAHVHLPPNFSAFETTRQALDLADAQGVGVLGASNYYDYSVYNEFAAQAGQRGIFPLFGLEIITLVETLVQDGVKVNDPGNPGKMYICGKGITRFAPLSDDAAQLLQVIRDNDSIRMAAVTDKLAAIFAGAGLESNLSAEAIKDRIVARHGCPRETVYLQERHVAQAFQEVFFDRVPEPDRLALLERLFGTRPKAQLDDAVAVQNEIRSHLMKSGKAGYVAETFVDFDHAYRLILALGGIPCYPTLADGAAPITEYEVSLDGLIADIKAQRVCSAEFIPIRNTPEVLSRYVHAMREAGLFVTAGTEHNTRDLLPIAPTCLNGEPIPDDLQEIFWEGACVVAAHQYLMLRGLPGFVDAVGTPNAEYGSANARIEAFYKLGASVIGQYQEQVRRGA